MSTVPDNYRANVATVEPLLVDAPTAAKLLGISQNHLRLQSQEGEIPCKKIGHRVLYSVALLRAYAEQTEKVHATERCRTKAEVT